MGLRKKLRTHIESVEEFNPEARDAQSAELERIHRLKLLQHISTSAEAADKDVYSTHGGAVPVGVVESSQCVATVEGVVRVSPESCQVTKGSSSPEIVQVEIGQPSAREAHHSSKNKLLEAIVIDSGSSDSDNSSSMGNNFLHRQGHPKDVPHPHSARNLPRQAQGRPAPSEGRQLLRKYDVVNYMRRDGRVLVNIGHAHNEPDVFLAPQIGRIVKSHQVRLLWVCLRVTVLILVAFKLGGKEFRKEGGGGMFD